MPTRPSVARSALLLAILAVVWRGADAQSQPQVLLQGRFYPGPSNGYATLPQTISWPASSVTAWFEGASAVTVNIQSLPANGNITFASSWFRFFIDDEPVQDAFTSYNAGNLSLALQTSSAPHRIRIVKLNEGTRGEAIVESITLSGGSFQSPQLALPPRRVLFLGDSFLSGFADTAQNHPEWCQPTAEEVTQDWNTTCTALKIYNTQECGNYLGGLNENSLVSFGPQTAQALDADFQVVSCSGGGLVGYAYSEAIDPGLTMAQYQELRPSNQLMYNRSVFTWPNATYDVTSWIPQVVMIDSGTNDWNANTSDYTQASWVQQAADFLEQMNKDFNSPIIVISVFPLTTPDGQGFQEGTTYQDAMQALYQEGLNRGLPKLNLLKIGNLSAAAVDNWCLHHPSVLAHAEVATQMAGLVSQLTGWPLANAIIAQPAIDFRPSTAFYTGGPNNLTATQAPAGTVPFVPLGTPGIAPASPVAAAAPNPLAASSSSGGQSPSPPPPPQQQQGSSSGSGSGGSSGSPANNPGSSYQGYANLGSSPPPPAASPPPPPPPPPPANQAGRSIGVPGVQKPQLTSVGSIQQSSTGRR